MGSVTAKTQILSGANRKFFMNKYNSVVYSQALVVARGYCNPNDKVKYLARACAPWHVRVWRRVVSVRGHGRHACAKLVYFNDAWTRARGTRCKGSEVAEAATSVGVRLRPIAGGWRLPGVDLKAQQRHVHWIERDADHHEPRQVLLPQPHRLGRVGLCLDFGIHTLLERAEL
jgi:hypothetical protein